MAEAIATSITKGIDIEISSAGISVYGGMPASPHSTECMSKMGLSLENHRARLVNQADINKADLVLTMTKAHKSYILQAFSNANRKTFTINEYAGEENDISDPYNLDYNAYDSCAKELHRLLLIISKKWGSGTF